MIDLPSKPEAPLVIAIAVAFVPSVVLGLLLDDFMKRVLFTPWVVAVALLVGGVVILVIERLAHRPRFTIRPRCRRPRRSASACARRCR